MLPISVQEAFEKPFMRLVMAGGGNRCWWQAGVMQELQKHPSWQIQTIVAASAAAGISAAFLLGELPAALAWCGRHFVLEKTNWDWGKLLKGERPSPMPRLYPIWLRYWLTEESFRRFKQQKIELDVVITRPLNKLPISLSTLLALGLYSSNKFITKRLHSNLPHRFGFRSDHLRLNDCANAQEAVNLLLATAAAVPLTPVYKIDQRPALDGGFYDSTPLPKISSQMDQAGRTLVLLTRYRKELATLFSYQNRIYLQPGAPVAAKNFDCTQFHTIEKTFAQGQQEITRMITI